MAINTNTYTLVNELVKQATGRTDLNVVDVSSLVSVGNYILSSNVSTEAFLNTLVERIGRTVIMSEDYEPKFKLLAKNAFEYGSILQMIDIQLIEAEETKTILTEGESVDPWVVHKPKVYQYLFHSESPYTYHITIQREWLKRAFTSESGIDQLVSSIMQQVRNSISLGIENLGRACFNNYVAEVGGTNREIKLLSLYNAEYPNPIAPLTIDTCLFDESFLRWAVAKINLVSKGMTNLTNIYNDMTGMGIDYPDKEDPILKQTPKSRQKLMILSLFETRLETVVQYQAFHDGYVKLNGYDEYEFLQRYAGDSNITDNTTIKVNRASDSAETTVSNVVGALFDTNALGYTYEENDVLATPVNPRGRYYNIFNHLNRKYFNKLNENFVIFTLN